MAQVVWALERDLRELDVMASKGKQLIFKKISKKPSKEIEGKINEFMEFHLLPPVSLDPSGIVDKIHSVFKHAATREKQFVNEIAPHFTEEQQSNITAALMHTSGIHQISKIIRHYLEMIRKYKMLQLALILQMQIPLIKQVSKALLESVDAFTKEVPIGDGIGPLVIASMIPANAKLTVCKDEEFVYAKTKVEGRTVILSKAFGPGTTIGYPGKFVQKLVKKNKINRIITVDAAQGLEGEKAGTIAEGVGVGTRGSELVAYHGFQIEEIAAKKNIVLDTIAIKEISQTSLYPMPKEILKSLPDAISVTKRAINRAGKNEKILIMGFGNTCGVGNNAKAAKEAEEKIKKHIKKKESAKKKQKRKKYKLF